MDWVLLALRIITVIILYTFLGVAFYIIWRSLKQAEAEVTESKPGQKLQVISAVNESAIGIGLGDEERKARGEK